MYRIDRRQTLSPIESIIEKQNVDLKFVLQGMLHDLSQKMRDHEVISQQHVSQNIHSQMADVREQIKLSFEQQSHGVTSHLHQLSLQMSNRLSEGFEKTSSTFTDIVKRLALIDEAQKKITELSTHVVSLQDVLLDKRSRGAFGEVQLNTLITNMMPRNHYEMQYTLSNQKRADCILFLPAPTGNIVIDSKFPLETFQKLMNIEPTALERKPLVQQFKQDLQKHIKDIAEKYIIPNETADGAMMFIPAEAIFAEIHANYPDMIALAHRLRVWLVSPTTLMAVLTTARAVLKDDATRQQVHVIQEHLRALADDFNRFEKRMDKLSKHIELAQQDVAEVNTSAKKITSRFSKIDAVELEWHESQSS